MAETSVEDMGTIQESMMLLDVISEYPETEAVFRCYDSRAGKCLLCHHLFETIAEVSMTYGLDKKKLLAELKKAALQE